MEKLIKEINAIVFTAMSDSARSGYIRSRDAEDVTSHIKTEIDTYLAQKDKEISELVDKLRYAHNTLVMSGFIKSDDVMIKINNALNKHKTINE